jgi:hypothetical protein
MKIKFKTQRLFLFIVLISLFAITSRPVLDADFWWHLRAGQIIIANHAIPITDPFSFTVLGNKWIAHEWLSESIIYCIYQLGGLTLLALIFSGIITTGYYLAYQRSQGQPYIAGFVTVLCAIASAPVWGVRPQMLTFFMFSLFLFLLENYYLTGKFIFIIPMPFLMALWVNLHAGYALGLFIIGFFIIFKFIESLLPDTRIGVIEFNPTKNLILPAIGVFFGCILAVLLNPNGAYMFVYPFETLNSSAMMTLIQEWFSPNFHSLEWFPLAAMIMLLIATGLYSRRRSSLTQTALVTVMAFAALRSMRNVPLFALTAIPVLSFHLDGILTIPINNTTSTKKTVLANLAILSLAFIAGIAFVTTTLSKQEISEKEVFPVAAVNWIRENRPEGRIFNTYGWGGYLIWNLYPDYPVFIDGRADVYGDNIMQEYMKIHNAIPGWEGKLQEAGVNIALVETGSPIFNALNNSPEWSLALKDKIQALFIRNTKPLDD